jgi:hypothetical protein
VRFVVKLLNLFFISILRTSGKTQRRLAVVSHRMFNLSITGTSARRRTTLPPP